VNDNQPQMFIQTYQQILPAALIVFHHQLDGPQCGFPGRNEERLKEMLCFKDVYDAPAMSQKLTSQR
jgi:hypothetical protein